MLLLIFAIPSASEGYYLSLEGHVDQFYSGVDLIFYAYRDGEPAKDVRINVFLDYEWIDTVTTDGEGMAMCSIYDLVDGRRYYWQAEATDYNYGETASARGYFTFGSSAGGGCDAHGLGALAAAVLLIPCLLKTRRPSSGQPRRAGASRGRSRP
jgi:hypothetical protein